MLSAYIQSIVGWTKANAIRFGTIVIALLMIATILLSGMRGDESVVIFLASVALIVVAMTSQSVVDLVTRRSTDVMVVLSVGLLLGGLFLFSQHQQGMGVFLVFAGLFGAFVGLSLKWSFFGGIIRQAPSPIVTAAPLFHEVPAFPPMTKATGLRPHEVPPPEIKTAGTESTPSTLG